MLFIVPSLPISCRASSTGANEAPGTRKRGIAETAGSQPSAGPVPLNGVWPAVPSLLSGIVSMELIQAALSTCF